MFLQLHSLMFSKDFHLYLSANPSTCKMSSLKCPSIYLCVKCVSDKSRVVVMDKSKGEPVISVKRGSKESRDKVKISTRKEKVSTAQVKSQTKETTSEGVKDKSKESKKDILSFDQVRVSNHCFLSFSIF